MDQPPRKGSDWNHLEKFLGEQIPFLPKGLLNNRMRQNGAWIGDYVQDVLKRSFAQGQEGQANVSEEEEDAQTSSAGERRSERSGRESSSAEELDCEVRVFETHQSVIVRIRIPDDMHYKNMKAYASQNEVRLEQEPMRRKRYVKLPRAVDPSAVRAVYKDGILELRLPKADEAELFQEIRVKYL